MPDAQDLHQIEYRHHQTRDLSPVASSMSRESVQGWDARIRAWVRHPHSENLSQSACYQVFPNGMAALAWRYWDKQAAMRADGSRGRPLVSRVLVGLATVLDPEAAVVLCRTGPAPELIGPLPGHVADDTVLPMVSGEAVRAMAGDMAAALDESAAAQDGLQAVLAAVLAEPSTPLAINAHDGVIRQPLRDGMQCLLLWGLRRIAGPVLGPAGREWSFSTFELPLGDMDPASLPRIVFRELQSGAQPPPARTRREIQVRPFAHDALGAETRYAARVGLAGWLVNEYREQGGHWLKEFITECCASEKTSQKRLERVYEALLAHRSQMIGSDEPTRAMSLLPGPPAAPESADDQVTAQDGLPQGDMTQADVMTGDWARAVSAVVTAAWAPEVTMPGREGPGREGPGHEAPDHEGPGREGPGREGPDHEGPDHEGPGREGPGREAPDPGAAEQEAAGQRAWEQDAAEPFRPDRSTADFGGFPMARDYSPASSQDDAALHPSPGWEQAAPGWQRGPQGGGYVPRNPQDAPLLADGTRKPLPSSKSSKPGLTPPGLPAPDRGGYPGGQQNSFDPPERDRHRRSFSLSSLLERLELVRDDQQEFQNCLAEIRRFNHKSVDPDDRRNSWDVIRVNGWYERISEFNSLLQDDIAHIFQIVVIPELDEPEVPEKIARWAEGSPDRMIEGLLRAARKTGPERWHYVMRILEPVLALQRAHQGQFAHQWDIAWVMRSAEYPGRGDGKGGARRSLWRRGQA